jgi:hypothetical protein
MKVLTANRLIDGEAVWFASDQLWAETIAKAEIAEDKEHEARLDAIGKAAYAANQVVDVELIDVELVCGEIVPLRLRERSRAARPTAPTWASRRARS